LGNRSKKIFNFISPSFPDSCPEILTSVFLALNPVSLGVLYQKIGYVNSLSQFWVCLDQELLVAEEDIVKRKKDQQKLLEVIEDLKNTSTLPCGINNDSKSLVEYSSLQSNFLKTFSHMNYLDVQLCELRSSRINYLRQFTQE